jgi:Ni,Fe-hydrogenase III large subunit/NADH:ubiquinone oxidoreductase subunit C
MFAMNQRSLKITNNSSAVGIMEIPVLEYCDFYDQVAELLKEDSTHCVAYYGIGSSSAIKFYCCIADDRNGIIHVLAHELDRTRSVLRSLTPVRYPLHIFEREIHENFGVVFEEHPWLKPVRYPEDRSERSEKMDEYPFYNIESEELHEVGVGPVHAGVIEPGHFRFICNGEKVLHLEIQLGYQHRGIERLFVEKNDSLQQCVLSESIAGDTVAGHALAHSQLIESLADIRVNEKLQIERCIALEMERLAVHIGDTAALCGDVAYQLGQVVCEALRTYIINTTQLWCGNRFGKGLIRPGGSNYPLSVSIADEIVKTISDVGRRFSEMNDLIYSLPSVLSRFDEIGKLTGQQALGTGAVGIAARASGILRDIRLTHPFQYFKNYNINAVTGKTGDVLARSMQRNLEAKESIKIIGDLIVLWRTKDDNVTRPLYNYNLKPESFALSLVEGWRGEICHTAVTDHEGKIKHYKVKDPSFHNWMSLALSVRNQEISDFPVCNKSFNLSYCGNDL